jgi:L,D-peptidoglycan transpeptidase YkuD (ErfK/YbiS/YcfS/YnhG family)
MLKLAATIYIMVGSMLAGSFVVAALTIGRMDAVSISVAAVLGALAGSAGRLDCRRETEQGHPSGLMRRVSGFRIPGGTSGKPVTRARPRTGGARGWPGSGRPAASSGLPASYRNRTSGKTA